MMHLGDCQNYGLFLGPYYNTGPNTGPNLGDPKRDHNFDNPPFRFLALGPGTLSRKHASPSLMVSAFRLRVPGKVVLEFCAG